MVTFLSPTLLAKTLRKHLDSIRVRDGNNATLIFCPNTQNSYFASANVPGQTVRLSLNEESGGFLSGTGFYFSNVTSLEVFVTILKNKSNSAGFDDIPLRFHKLFTNLILNRMETFQGGTNRENT
jgi:hypothetical protein